MAKYKIIIISLTFGEVWLVDITNAPEIDKCISLPYPTGGKIRCDNNGKD